MKGLMSPPRTQQVNASGLKSIAVWAADCRRSDTAGEATSTLPR
jgi:hypothetical protein